MAAMVRTESDCWAGTSVLGEEPELSIELSMAPDAGWLVIGSAVYGTAAVDLYRLRTDRLTLVT